MRSLWAILLAVGLILLVPLLLDDADTDVDPVAQDRVHPQGGRYRCPVPGVANLNPLTQNEAVAERYVLRYTHDTLFDRDPRTGDLRPGAAMRIEHDDRRVVFFLRDDLVFGDGSALGRSDLEFLVEVSRHPRLQPKSTSSSWLSEAESVAVVDSEGELRLEVVFETWSRTAFERFATGVRLIQRRHFVDAVRDLDKTAEPMSDAFVDLCSSVTSSGPGTGPYTAPADGTPASTGRFVMRANPGSWHRRARPESWNLAAIELRFLSDPAATLAAALDEEVDFHLATSSDIEALQERHQVLRERFERLVMQPAHLGTWYLAWNQKHPPFDDLRVRQALEHAIDRDGLTRLVYGDEARPAYGYYRDSGRDPRRFDLPTAERKLRDLDHDPSAQRPLQFVFARGTRLGEATAAILRDAFDRLGWPLETEGVDDARIGRIIDDGAFDLVLVYGEHFLPRDPFESFHSSRSRLGANDAELDQILESLRRAADPERTRELFEAFEDRLQDTTPITPLTYPGLSLLLHKRFSGVDPGPLGLVPEYWWVDPSKQI